MGLKEETINAIVREMELRQAYLGDEKIETIYFGGGTPSILNTADLETILKAIRQLFNIQKDAEVTLEANPDDLCKEKLAALYRSGINRLSIGVQSFFKEDLIWMNRSHDEQQSHDCILNAYEIGFSNISIDLIFGSPTTPLSHWLSNLDQAVKYKVPHISCYGLTVEENTALKHMIDKGKTKAPIEEDNVIQFEKTIETLELAGYQHYEISNYCLPGKTSVHNTNYWLGEKYLGVGPSAHSFNGESREWNVNNNKKYIDAIKLKQVPSTKETLGLAERYNEYVLTGLRTSFGCDLNRINEFGDETQKHFERESLQLIESGDLLIIDNIVTLSKKAKLLADSVIAELFI